MGLFVVGQLLVGVALVLCLVVVTLWFVAAKNATPATAGPAFTVDADGRLTTDLACRMCEYQLSGLAPEGACPECGASIAESLDRLANGDPAWLARLYRGTWVLLGAGILYKVAGASPIIDIVAMTGRVFWVAVAYATVLAALGFMLAIGAFAVLTPDPSRAPVPSRLRAIGRSSIFAAAATGPISFFWIASLQSGGVSPVLQGVLGILNFLTFVAVSIGEFAIFRELRRHAIRLPHAGLARQSTLLFWTYVAQFTAALLWIPVTWAIAARFTANTLGVTFGIIRIATLSFALVVGIWTVVVLLRFQGHFGRASRSRG